ncbi:hypothetical protein BsWGS_19702 [Bradybaena similaris]
MRDSAAKRRLSRFTERVKRVTLPAHGIRNVVLIISLP